MDPRLIGDRTVHPIGLGAMQLSRPGRDGSVPDRDRAVATVHAALDRGVTLIDTADCYTPDDWSDQAAAPLEAALGHNEYLVAEALRGRPGDLLVATKGGIRRRGPEWPVDGRPEWIHRAARATLRRLGVDALDLHQHHRPDPEVPYAETIGAFRELHDAGLVKQVGISNVDTDLLRVAHDVLGDALVAVQDRLGPDHLENLPVVEACRERGLAFLAYAPFGGMRASVALGETHHDFAEVAADHEVSPQRVCLAWLLARWPHVVPIPGASRPESIIDSVAATDLALTPEELDRLDAAAGRE